MDLSKITDTLGDLAARGGDAVEQAAETVKDKVVDLVPDSVKAQAEALGDKAVDAVTGAIGAVADKLQK